MINDKRIQCIFFFVGYSQFTYEIGLTLRLYPLMDIRANARPTTEQLF